MANRGNPRQSQWFLMGFPLTTKGSIKGRICWPKTWLEVDYWGMLSQLSWKLQSNQAGKEYPTSFVEDELDVIDRSKRLITSGIMLFRPLNRVACQPLQGFPREEAMPWLHDRSFDRGYWQREPSEWRRVSQLQPTHLPGSPCGSIPL